jgi:hypothetical protein
MPRQRTRYEKNQFGSINRVVIERAPLRPNEKYAIQAYRHKRTGRVVRMAEKQLGTRGWPAEDYELVRDGDNTAPLPVDPPPAAGMSSRERAAAEADLKRMTKDALCETDEWGLVPDDVKAECSKKDDIVAAILDVRSQL